MIYGYALAIFSGFIIAASDAIVKDCWPEQVLCFFVGAIIGHLVFK